MRKIKKKNQCLIIENHKFLWWKWQEEYTYHKWVYKNKKERKCLKCGEWQIFFRESYYEGIRSEEWRTKLKSAK